MFLYCTSNRGLNSFIFYIPDLPDCYAALCPMIGPGRGHKSLQWSSYTTVRQGQGQKCIMFRTISLLKVIVSCVHDHTAHPRSIDERYFISKTDKTWQLIKRKEGIHSNVSTDIWIIDSGWFQYKNWLQELFSIIIYYYTLHIRCAITESRVQGL